VTQYHVTLNAQGYILDLDRYAKRVRDPFVTRQSTGAVAIADLRGPEQVLVISDWSGGEGYAQHDEAHPERWRSGSGLDGYTMAGALRLGPHREASVIPSGTLTSFRPLTVYKGKLIVGSSGVQVFTWDGTTLANPFNVPAGTATCGAVFEDRLYVGNSTDGKLSTWDGTTLTPAIATAGGPIHALATHYRQAAQYLYVGSQGAGVNGVARAYYWDGSALSLGQFDFEEARTYAALVLGTRLYWVVGDSVNRRWGIYSVDNSGSGGSWVTHARVDTGYGVSAAVLSDVLYVGDGVSGRIWAWDGSSLRVVRELSSGGSVYTGELLGLVAWRGALWVSVVAAGGGLELLRYDPTTGAWSRPVTGFSGASGAVERMLVFGDRLFVGSNRAGSLGLVEPVDPLTFGSTGTLTSGLISCGLPGVSKLFRSVTIVTSAIASPQTVKVEYQLEDTGAFTTLGTLSAVGATTATYAFPASTVGRQIAFRVTLTGTAGAASSPVLYELAVRYVPQPAVTREWELAVVLEGTPELPLVTLDGTSEPLTGAQLTAALWSAAGAVGPVTLVDLDGTSYTVYVQNLREEIGKLSQRRGYQRLGLVTLVEAA
jgi:hypothetical protein